MVGREKERPERRREVEDNPRLIFIFRVRLDAWTRQWEFTLDVVYRPFVDSVEGRFLCEISDGRSRFEFNPLNWPMNPWASLPFAA